jgi:hypothetical protein
MDLAVMDGRGEISGETWPKIGSGTGLLDPVTSPVSFWGVAFEAPASDKPLADTAGAGECVAVAAGEGVAGAACGDEISVPVEPSPVFWEDDEEAAVVGFVEVVAAALPNRGLVPDPALGVPNGRSGAPNGGAPNGGAPNVGAPRGSAVLPKPVVPNSGVGV